MLIILDRQHCGKPGNPGDRGALADLDRDGRIEQWEMEAALTPHYLLSAEAVLLDAGLDVICMSDGTYEERHARACRYGAGIYVAAHLNTGAAWGAAFHDQRSRQGAALAQVVAGELQVACPELTEARPRACWDDRPEAQDRAWLWRPWMTLRGVYVGRPVGICYEPASLDVVAHAPLLTRSGLERLGRALGIGIINWVGGR